MKKKYVYDKMSIDASFVIGVLGFLGKSVEYTDEALIVGAEEEGPRLPGQHHHSTRDWLTCPYPVYQRIDLADYLHIPILNND